MQNEIIKPTVDGVLSIMRSCKEAGTVRRVVFTSSAGTVNVQEQQQPQYDESSWSDIDFCRRVKMTGWVTLFPILFSRLACAPLSASQRDFSCSADVLRVQISG